MNNTVEISGFKCFMAFKGGEQGIVYMIYPEIASLPDKWIESMATRYNVAVVVVNIPASGWNDDLTPWPEPGEAKGCEPFGGKASEFLKVLQQDIIPGVEKRINPAEGAERNLIGVSLSGLFALWQWMQYDIFHSIACLSGSYWYVGFLDWFDKQPVPSDKGAAFFLLGRDEPHASVKLFRSVGVNTEAVVKRLKEAGVSVTFEWVPGNHFSNPQERAEKAFAFLYR